MSFQFLVTRRNVSYQYKRIQGMSGGEYEIVSWARHSPENVWPTRSKQAILARPPDALNMAADITSDVVNNY